MGGEAKNFASRLFYIYKIPDSNDIGSVIKNRR